MYKWNISNGSVEMIQDDKLTGGEFNEDDNHDVIVDQAEDDKVKFIESHMTAEEANSVPKTARLDIVVCILKLNLPSDTFLNAVYYFAPAGSNFEPVYIFEVIYWLQRAGILLSKVI